MKIKKTKSKEGVVDVVGLAGEVNQLLRNVKTPAEFFKVLERVKQYGGYAILHQGRHYCFKFTGSTGGGINYFINKNNVILQAYNEACDMYKIIQFL
jgi:hypothetical protein